MTILATNLWCVFADLIQVHVPSLSLSSKPSPAAAPPRIIEFRQAEKKAHAHFDYLCHPFLSIGGFLFARTFFFSRNIFST
jgi:hypothetical protein